jgi:hypothetical protein
MANRNIHQITDFSQLKKIVSKNLTVVIGMICSTTSNESKIMVKKFLKRKAELFPLVQFVFINLSDEQIQHTKLEIVSDDYDLYPLIYHIRDGNKIACKVENADYESTYGSFNQIAPYYTKDMEHYTQTLKAKKAKKSNVIMNLSNSDSESQIEIDDTQKQNAESIDMQNNPDNTNNTNNDDKPNNNEPDPQVKMYIEREKYHALEEKYNDMQKELFENIKQRVKIEKKARKEEEKENKNEKKEKEKSTSKSKNRKNRNKNDNDDDNDNEKHIEPPKRDQIGTSSKAKQSVRRGRR